MSDTDKKMIWEAFNSLCSDFEAGQLVKPDWWDESVEVPFPSYEACLLMAKHRVDEFKRILKERGGKFRWDLV